MFNASDHIYPERGQPLLSLQWKIIKRFFSFDNKDIFHIHNLFETLKIWGSGMPYIRALAVYVLLGKLFLIAAGVCIFLRENDKYCEINTIAGDRSWNALYIRRPG